MPRTITRILTIACAALVVGLIFCGQSHADESAKTQRHPIKSADLAGRSSSNVATSSAGFWLSTGGVAVALAVFGAYSLAAKKVRPPSDSPSLRVIGRASLTARQSVYLVRVGDRTLIVGAGHQGPPSLLGELTETHAPIVPEKHMNTPHIAPISRIGGNV